MSIFFAGPKIDLFLVDNIMMGPATQMRFGSYGDGLG